MPELPEVENVVRGLRPNLVDLKIDFVAGEFKLLRRPLDPESWNKLKNKKIKKVLREAKYIIIELERKIRIYIHLGMTGKLVFSNDANLIENKHSHAVMHFYDTDKRLIFNDARRFGLFVVAKDYYINEGIDPTSDDFTFERFQELCAKSERSNLKGLLMNGEKIAGIGNIYACEILFRAKISPLRKMETCNAKEIRALYDAIVNILMKAIEAGGSTIKDYRLSNDEKGSFQKNFQVYQQKVCKTCENKIETIRQNSRSTFFCPQCQK